MKFTILLVFRHRIRDNFTTLYRFHRRGRAWPSLTSWHVSQSIVRMVLMARALSGRVQTFYYSDIKRCLDLSSSTVIFLTALISLRTLVFPFFWFFITFFPAHSLLQWKFCVNQKSQIVPLTQQRHCPFFSQVYKLHWSQWCDFDLCGFWIRPVWTVDAFGRISSAVKREKGYAGTRTMTYDTALQHRWLWFIILDASRAFFFFFLEGRHIGIFWTQYEKATCI